MRSTWAIRASWPEAGAEPGGVVIAPDEGDVGLLAQVVDDAVAARPAVPAVAADDQLVNRQVADQPHRQRSIGQARSCSTSVCTMAAR